MALGPVQILLHKAFRFHLFLYSSGIAHSYSMLLSNSCRNFTSFCAMIFMKVFCTDQYISFIYISTSSYTFPSFCCVLEFLGNHNDIRRIGYSRKYFRFTARFSCISRTIEVSLVNPAINCQLNLFSGFKTSGFPLRAFTCAVFQQFAPQKSL